MDFALPDDLVAYLDTLDRFIETDIKPLENADDNIRYFDHRREWARTDFEKGGLPRPEWEKLLREAKNRADKAGLRADGGTVEDPAPITDASAAA